jgi:hypothetical protein
LEGTIAALRDAAMKKAEITISERKTRKIGFVVKAFRQKWVASRSLWYLAERILRLQRLIELTRAHELQFI